MIYDFLVINYISHESYRRREMYSGHARLSVCLPAAACPHYCTDPDVSWVGDRGCPLVVHYWADLRSVYGLRCYDKIARTRTVSEYMLVPAVCLVMAALRSRCVHYIFVLFLLLGFPPLISAVAD